MELYRAIVKMQQDVSGDGDLQVNSWLWLADVFSFHFQELV